MNGVKRSHRRYLPLIAAVVASLVASLFSSCATRTDDRFQSRKGHFLDAILGASSYQREFLDKTVERSVYSEFEGILQVSITPFHNDLRNSYIKEMRRQLRLSEEDEARLAAELLQEDATFAVFIIAVDTREPHWNDLDKQRSIWRVFAANRDASIQVRPERIEVLPQKDEQTRYFHPTMTDFNRTYRIRFNRRDLATADPIRFVISGVRGVVEASFPNDHLTELR